MCVFFQDVGDEAQLAAVLDMYPVYRAIWAVHQNEAFGDKVMIEGRSLFPGRNVVAVAVVRCRTVLLEELFFICFLAFWVFSVVKHYLFIFAVLVTLPTSLTHASMYALPSSLGIVAIWCKCFR